MAAPRFQGELVEDTPKPRFGGELVPETKIETPVSSKTKSPLERITQLGESTLGGTILGAATPELVEYAGKGIAKLPSPYAKAGGYGIEAAGRLMKTQRGASAGAGALSGATADIAGQGVEIAGGQPPAVFLAELAGGFVGPQFAKTVTDTIRYGSRKLLGIEPITAIKNVAEDLGINEAILSPSQRKFIKDQIEKLRGGKPSSTAQEGVYGALKTGATDITREAENRALYRKFEADMASKEAEAKAEKMRLAGKKTTEIGAEAKQQADAARSQIGADREPSIIGGQLRDKINSLYGKMTKARSDAYDQQKAIRDAAVAEKESTGQLVKDTPEYKALVDNLKSKLLIGPEAQKQATAPVTEKGVLQAYQNIYDAVTSRRVKVGLNAEGNPVYKTFPTSFDALDDVRRRLGDVAFGKEVEGYSAIGSNIAKDFYGKISNIQSKFAGESHDVLQSEYEAASRLLEKYKSKRGAKATAEDRFDPTRYKTDAASLPNDYFTNQQSVKDLIELTGGDRGLVVQAGSDFAAKQLKDKSLKSVKDWSNKNSDWLSALPEVKGKVDAYIKVLERTERISGKTGKAAKILEAREPTVLRGGEKAVTAAEKEAEAITAEASDRVKTILGDKNPAARVREIILGGKPSVWQEVGPILAQNPQGKKLIADSVLQIMADRAESGLVSSVRAFREDVAPSLKVAGLMSDAQLKSLEAQLQTIANSAMGEPAKLTFIQRAIKDALVGVASQPVGQLAVEAGKLAVPKSAQDVLNRKGQVGTVQPRFK
jgi:hypothetical protein